MISPGITVKEDAAPSTASAPTRCSSLEATSEPLQSKRTDSFEDDASLPLRDGRHGI